MFNDSHNPNRPLQFWFQESHEGVILFIVFYTQACRYGRCVGCNLYQQQSPHPIDRLCLIRQIDQVFHDEDILARSQEVNKIILSNNGSILDEQTFSSTALTYFMFLVGQHFPFTRVLSLETRPEYVSLREMEFLSHIRQETILENIEIAIGVEAFSDHIRNVRFNKNLSIEAIEHLIERVSAYHFGVKCYFMFKPVSHMTTIEAINDIQSAIDFLDGCAQKYNVDINLHLNPTYVARGTCLASEFLQGLYEPPYLIDIVQAVKLGKGKRLNIFVGLNDEGLAVEGGSFLRAGDEGLVKTLEEFNKTQNYALLQKL
jgi:radical SAM enzyme (TIGR01210 family)